MYIQSRGKAQLPYVTQYPFVIQKDLGRNQIMPKITAKKDAWNYNQNKCSKSPQTICLKSQSENLHISNPQMKNGIGKFPLKSGPPSML